MKIATVGYRLIPCMAFLVLIVGSFAACDSAPAKGTGPDVSEGNLSVKCQSYSFTFVQDEGGESFDVLCNGTDIVYTVSADYLHFISEPADIEDTSEGTISAHDIDGNGTPDLIVEQENGNCCVDYTFISLGEILSQYDIEHVGGDFELIDLDHDGKFEIKALDTSIYDSVEGVGKFDEPTPQIILEIVDGKYQLSERFLKETSPLNLPREIKRFRATYAESGDIPPPDKKILGEWIYHGHGKQALQYFDAVYDHTRYETAKNNMIDDVIAALMNGPHWEQLSAMNKWMYVQPDGELACPEFVGRARLVETK